MIHAEVSIYPMATKTPSASFYISKALESIQDVPDIRYQLNPMGTVLESKESGTIYDAIQKMTETVHNLGVSRVGVVIKVDSRRDKERTMEQKVDAVKRNMAS